MRGNTYSSNACIVQADQEVSVLAVCCKSRACVTSLLYPVGYWGNQYYAITPQVPQQETYRQIGITNHKYKNTIEIFLTSQVTFQGTLYSKGDVVKITLSEFQSVQLQGANSLSAQKSGLQIPWGLSYVVPPWLLDRVRLGLRVAFQNTRINIQYNTAQQLKDVLGGTVAQFQVDPSSPMYITASQGVQVIYFCPGSAPGVLPAVAPFMMGIADTGTYCFNYTFTAMPSFQNSAVMVAKGANGILIALDQKPLPPDVRWSPVKESDYSWAVMAIAIGDHSVRQQGGIFGLYIVGTASESSYGYPAVCTERTMNCLENSHYESCGSACPATCSDPEASFKCKFPCVETCQCNTGSGLTSCTQQCTCDLYTSRVTCKQASCKPSEECRLVDGVWGCYPSVNSFKTCSAEGDPHYITFDGCWYDFQGTCIYQLVALCSYNPSLTPFEVHVQNDNRESTVVSYSKMVMVKVYGITIEISKDNSGKVQVDGILINLPYSFSNGKVKIYRIGMNAVVRTDFGLRLTFDWSSRVTATVSAAYSGSLCGLCGNYNGDPADDMIGKNGQTVLSPDAFGESWKTGDVPGCVDRCQGSCPVCSDKEKWAYAGSGFCGRITDPSGPFRDCLGVVDPKRFFENCVYDVCIYKGLQSILCQSIASYVATCQEVGPTSILGDPRASVVRVFLKTTKLIC
ncbi:IgGFc-binding protein-like isoform X1 [Acipenser oxyrinchus oxyrinchus]|uniref:IgGFc-binding protein-like isoform X1 n=1 Tax=Acipenser oxyrinchus oxyrinchus TaxID=40147 RepID=A0AAD8FTB8_ACIOX|nr:IgGFc-binding protein-like isoform X1 [Acipenser oxyrinchus oxyrinchus]